ncbi:hypothetical protein [Weissella soli]|uniref:hypothetical protein n=1 Tax=Weissella soli TaxID=155866 RepID=UPI0011BBA001|nr:hypothetical protein [Weissella soli]QEA34765.1 hypothetical protein FGL88_02925 [Weissella soli]
MDYGLIVKNYLPALISVITVGFLIWNNLTELNHNVSRYAENVAVWDAMDYTLRRSAFFINVGNTTPIYNVFVIRGRRAVILNRDSINSNLQRDDVGFSRLITPGHYKYVSDSIIFKGMEMGKSGLPEEYAIIFTDSSGHRWFRASDGKLTEIKYDYYSKLTTMSNLSAPLGDMTIVRTI